MADLLSNDVVRQVTQAGVVTTLAGLAGGAGSADGTGSNARFDYPSGIATDNNGNVYLADSGNATVRKGFPASSVPAPVLHSPIFGGGQFGFGITGVPGLVVNVESSSNFSNWQVVANYVVLAGGTNSFVSPASPPGNQFYRAQVR